MCLCVGGLLSVAYCLLRTKYGIVNAIAYLSIIHPSPGEGSLKFGQLITTFIFFIFYFLYFFNFFYFILASSTNLLVSCIYMCTPKKYNNLRYHHPFQAGIKKNRVTHQLPN